MSKPYDGLPNQRGNSPEALRSRGRHRKRYWRENDRDEYECPRCGRGMDEVHSFEVHHIDRNPLNGDKENLVALCRECHYREHGRSPPESLEEWKERIQAERLA